MSDTKKVIYKGPYAEIRVPDVSGFVRGEVTEIDGDKADELTLHKPGEYSLAEGEKKAEHCPCDRCQSARAAEKAAADEKASAETAVAEAAASPAEAETGASESTPKTRKR